MAAIPDSLSCLASLQQLYLSQNRITAIPDLLSHLTNLQLPALPGNQITALPGSLSSLTDLRLLDLDRNQITAIPDWLSRLTNLREVDLCGNPLPDELLAAARRGPEALFRYIESAGYGDHPRTVKLVLLGEPQSGKTTLVEALKGNKSPCDRSARRRSASTWRVSTRTTPTTGRRCIFPCGTSLASTWSTPPISSLSPRMRSS